MQDNLDDNLVVARFLDHYSEYGSNGHLIAAQALQAGMGEHEESSLWKLLAVKVYGEFMSAMEDLGALCIAIRHREDHHGLIYAYLTYGQRDKHAPSTRLNDIFQLMSSGNALTSALDLPTLEDILIDNPDVSDSILPQLYSEANGALKTVSSAYLYDNRAYIRAYNKTKHGFVVVDDPSVVGDQSTEVGKDIAWIVADNPDFKQNSTPNVSAIELCAVPIAEVGPMIERIAFIRGAVIALCGLVVYLLERGLIEASGQGVSDAHDTLTSGTHIP